jgi:hypothetical protein
MKFLSVLLLSPLLLCALGSATLTACSSATSDESQVRAVVASAEQAAEERDVGDVLDLVDEQYADAQGNTRDSLALFLRAWFVAHPKVELVTTVDDLQFPVAGLARARVTVRGFELDRFNAGEAVTLDVELRREGGEWRVVRADRVREG